MANGNGRTGLRDKIKEVNDKVWGSQVAESILRPGSPFKKGYSDSPRNRSYVVMNNVLYHLHPVKVKRHGVKLSYTLCLGGLSFFLFILLTITGIVLMFYYTPSAETAYADIEALSTNVAFGSLVRNMHRWGAHLMVLSVFLHMSRVFYHGAYKPPREWNWAVGTFLLFCTLWLSFTGYLLPWDQIAFWAVNVGNAMAAYAPAVPTESAFIIFSGIDIGPQTLIRFYVYHVIAFPLIMAIFLMIHFWRIRKDGGISGPV
ncbi:MAG: cytochrome b N-terminal domain-containing protein [Acidimicrobiia bacterium]